MLIKNHRAFLSGRDRPRKNVELTEVNPVHLQMYYIRSDLYFFFHVGVYHDSPQFKGA
jgi:hypothetical protein